MTQHQERDRFLQEARTAGLSHLNIVPVHLVEAHRYLVLCFVDRVPARARWNGPAREHYEHAIALARSPAERVSFERRIESLGIS